MRPGRRDRLGLWLGAAIAAEALVLLWAERARPRRPRPANDGARVAENAVLALAGAVPVAIERAVALRVARWAVRSRAGLVPRLRLSPRLETLAGIVLLDWSMYVWHRLTHRVPWLWRLHLVHHVDPALDASTALRFHPAELGLSIAYRAAQIAAFGVTPRAYLRWQAFLAACILFHHANVALPPGLERALGWLVVTPRLHAIHHSERAPERSKNWSDLLALWDVLHRTRSETAAPPLVIGVEGERAPASLAALFALPFRKRGSLSRWLG